LGAILDTPGLAERLLEALRPELAGNPSLVRKSQGRESRREELKRADHDRGARNRVASLEGRRVR